MKKLLVFILCFFSFLSYSFAYNKAVVDITEMDIYEIQDAIDKGYLTYELLTKLYLDRIEAYDKNFNTIITLNENIIEEAKELDEIYKISGRNSILFGIPILVKDNIDVKGMPTTNGTISLNDNYPKDDAQIIKYLKDNNALIIGKTNMSEFAFQAYSTESSYGKTRNAYNTYFTSYGSSGGSAVAVSLQFGLLGIGTDTNASLRLPASANNVIGFRPTFNNLSNDGIINYDITRDIPGPITKTVKENAILMAIMEGKDENTYLKNIDSLKLNNIKIGVIDDFLYGNDSNITGTGKTYTEIENLMKDTLNLLEEQDVEIIHLKDFYKQKYNNISNNTLGGWTMCHAFNDYIKDSPSKINSFYKLTLDKGHIYSLWSYLTDCTMNIDAIDEYDFIKKEYDSYIKSVYEKYDLDFLVYPTSKNRVLKLEDDRDNLSTPTSLIAPVLGYPSVAVSIGKDADNLYYGMDIVAQKSEEEKLYKFLKQYEQINSKYTLSSLAPPLYEISKEVKELVALYESNLSKDIIINLRNNKDFQEYKKVQKQVKEFILNYNEIDENEIQDKATSLLNQYKTVSEKVNSSINITILTIIIPLVLIIVLIIIFIKKRKK